MTIEALIAHLVGDYLLQSHWMATCKLTRWWPAIVHGLCYTLPFLLITQSPAALLVIGGTHIVLDRYRAARYVIWLKNLLAPAGQRLAWREVDQATGFSRGTPAGLALALLIVIDNTMHVLINAGALTWLA